jgi:hypothetical protein
MSTQTEELRTVLTVDDTQAVAGLRRGAQGIEDYGRRAERVGRAVGDAGREIAAGLSSGGRAADVLLAGLTRIGAAVALPLGIGAMAARKLHDDLNQVRTATAALHRELARPIEQQAALGPDGISAELQRVTERTEELVRKQQTLGAKLQRAAIQGQPDYFDTSRLQKVEADRTVPGDKEVAEGRRRIRELSAARANAEMEAVKVKGVGLRQSEREAALAKITRTENERLAKLHLDSKLRKPGDSARDLLVRHAAIRFDAELDRETTNKKFDGLEREIQLREELLEISMSERTEDEKASASARARMNAANLRAVSAQTKEERSKANTEAKAAERELNKVDEEIARKTGLLRTHVGLRETLRGIAGSDATADVRSLAGVRARLDAARQRQSYMPNDPEARANAEQDARDAEHELREERLRQFRANLGPAGAAHRRAQREEARLRRQFSANDADRESRQSRGAYDRHPDAYGDGDDAGSDERTRQRDGMPQRKADGSFKTPEDAWRARFIGTLEGVRENGRTENPQMAQFIASADRVVTALSTKLEVA